MLANFLQNVLLAAEKRIGPALARSDAWLRPTVVVVNALLVVALAYALADLAAAMLWTRLPLPASAAPAPGSPSSEMAITQQPADYAAVGAWHLFGQMEAPRLVEAPPPPASVTPLNLRLVGVFFIERGGKALALIAEGSGLERSYRSGEELPGGARLDRIQRDSVIISHGGQQDTLNLPRLDSADRSPASGDMPPVLPGDAPAPAEAPGQLPEQSMNANPQPINAAMIASRLHGAADQSRVLQDLALAIPSGQNGRFLGFRLRPGRVRQLMKQLGLDSGDVITEVNGTRFDNPLQGLSVLQGLKDAGRIDVRVLRHGTEIPLAVSLGKPTVQ
ncbi:MAG: type II secretion system protein N [Candidatus Competibacter sp.]